MNPYYGPALAACTNFNQAGKAWISMRDLWSGMISELSSTVRLAERSLRWYFAVYGHKVLIISLIAITPSRFGLSIMQLRRVFFLRCATDFPFNSMSLLEAFFFLQRLMASSGLSAGHNGTAQIRLVGLGCGEEMGDVATRGEWTAPWKNLRQLTRFTVSRYGWCGTGTDAGHRGLTVFFCFVSFWRIITRRNLPVTWKRWMDL